MPEQVPALGRMPWFPAPPRGAGSGSFRSARRALERLEVPGHILKPGALTKVFLQKNKARRPCGLRAKFGGGRSPRALSLSHNVWRSRNLRAMCFPTLLTAACNGVGLIAGPSKPFQAGIYRVRPLRPVRHHLPVVRSPDGCWHACKNTFRTGTLTTGSAPAFGRAFAPCDGSDLLTLRLLSTCSWVIPLGGTAPIRRFASFARLA